MPSKNAARILKAFKNFNLFFLKNIRFPSLKKEEDIVISIRIGDKTDYREGFRNSIRQRTFRTALLTKKSDNHSLCQISFTVGGRSSEKCEKQCKVPDMLIG